MTDRHIILGIVASAIASKRADSPYRSSTQINYSEHIADRVLEVLGAKGFEIVEKEARELNRHWPTWADVPEGVWVRGENASPNWEWIKRHGTAYALDLNHNAGYPSALTSSQLDALAPFKAVQL